VLLGKLLTNEEIAKNRIFQNGVIKEAKVRTPLWWLRSNRISIAKYLL
jgi:hypothetical protein